MIADNFRQSRRELETVLGQLLRLGTELDREPATLDTLHELLTQVREPLLFIAIGEPRTGKSSLPKALFGEDAADGVDVVDKPAASTPEDQSMLEDCLTRADVVLYVLSVTNPWSESAWQSLELVRTVGLKKVVFVLQQSDLRDATQLDVIHRHLSDTAARKLGSAVPVFSASAQKASLATKHALIREELWRESGFGPLTNYINGILAESGARFARLQTIAAKAATIANDVADEIHRSMERIERDEKHLERIRQFLDVRKEDSLRAVPGFFRDTDQAVQSFEAELRNVWTKLQDAIEAGFSAAAKGWISATNPDFAALRPRSTERAAAEQQMKGSVQRFYQEIATAFEPLAAFCVSERKRNAPLVEEADSVKELLSGLSRRLGA